MTTPDLQDYIKHSMKHEKELAEEAMKRAMQGDTDTPENTTTTPREGPTPVTTSVSITSADAKKAAIDFNHKVDFIAIKFDDTGDSDGKGEAVDEVVVEEVEGVSLPQVVSGGNGRYLLDLPGIDDGESQIIPQHGVKPQHITATTTTHYTSPQLPHNTSPQDCTTTTTT